MPEYSSISRTQLRTHTEKEGSKSPLIIAKIGNIMSNNGRLVTTDDEIFYSRSVATKKSDVEIYKLTGREVHDMWLDGRKQITKQWDSNFIRHSFSPFLQGACAPREGLVSRVH